MPFFFLSRFNRQKLIREAFVFHARIKSLRD